MTHRVLSVLMAGALVAFACTAAFAQGGSTSQIAGTVVDTSGGLIPGATIEAKNDGTAAVFTAVSGSRGAFVIAAVPTGKYTVTVKLQGFKAVVLNGVECNAGVPVTLKAVLELGGLTETIVVEGATPVVQTQATSVSTTINTRQIESLPLTSRNVIDFLAFLPGVNVASTTRNANVNGLPGSAVNITLDGVNIQDNTNKSGDGFFTIVQPRLDAIEEVTITGAAAGVNDSQGAISVKFVTRSGTNRYTGSVYNYYRSDTLNENTWFNERDKVAKAKLQQNQTGGRFGGPIRIPGLYDGRGKAFFFLNVENFYQPSGVTRTRTILQPSAQLGVFSWVSGAGVSTVDLLATAAAAGQLGTVDPTIGKLLADIRGAAAGFAGGSILDTAGAPTLQNFTYNVPVLANNWFPTFRVDLNIGQNHRLSSVYNHDVFSSVPDTLNGLESAFPGFPVFGSQTSSRIALSNTVRSTFGGDVVNEARFAVQGSPVLFFAEQYDPGIWNGTLANQKGFQLGINAAGINNASPGPNAQSRNVKVFLYEDTLNWQKGSHSFSSGVSVSDFHIWLKNQTTVPTISFGMQNTDPAQSVFNSVPGLTGANLTAAKNLYAVLTGRVTQISGNARIDEATGKYVYSGPAVQRGSMVEMGTYIQDNWRIKSNLTLNYGVRYELQGPFSAANSLYSFGTAVEAFGVSGLSTTCDPIEPTAQTCNIFKNGVMPGVAPTLQQLTKGSKAYNTDYNNWSPSIGVNWTPSSDQGFLRALMGEPGQFALRGAWTRGYLRNGLGDFTGVFNSNPGIRINNLKNESAGNLGSSLVLLRNDSQLSPAPFNDTPSYPLTPLVTDSVNVFAQNARVPYADTYTFGVQRGLSKTMAFEVRYVGTRSRDSITSYNLNETNIIENGFLNEFKLAQANLQANIDAGRGATFRYFGAGTGTVPLPIFLAYFSGRPSSSAGDETLYTSASFSNATFVNPLAKFNPNPFSEAGNLSGVAGNRANALTAGLPANFFVVNPNVLGGASITGNGGFTKYNSIQMELRRRLSNGLQFQANYVFGRGYQSARYSFRVPRKAVQQTGGGGDVTQALKANVVFDLPFGRGRRFYADAGSLLDALVGGWQVNFNTRLQSGRLVDYGNVRMVGFTASDLKDMYKIRIDSAKKVYSLPVDVINESIKAFSVSATSASGYSSLGAPSGKYFAPANSNPACIETISNNYGDCGTRTLVARGPTLYESDMSLVKAVTFKGNYRAEFRIEALNVFNHVNYTPVTIGGNGQSLTNYEVTGLTAINTARVVQLVTRFSW